MINAKAKKRVNILKMLSSRRFGANRRLMLNLNKSIVLSTLDYGSILYGNAARMIIKKSDSTYHQGLRIASGAFRTSPVESIMTETYSLPLNLIREQRSYGMNVLSNDKHPLYQKLSRSLIYNMRGNNKRTIVERLGSLLFEVGVEGGIFSRNERSKEPWFKDRVKYNTELVRHSRSDITNEVLQNLFLEAKSKYSGSKTFYTDGSKKDNDNLAGYGIKSDSTNVSVRIQITQASLLLSALPY